MPENRGKGVATKLLLEIINHHETEFDAIYAHIWHTNEARVRCMKRIGFEEIGRLSTTKFLKKCVKDDGGKLILVAYKKADKE